MWYQRSAILVVCLLLPFFFGCSDDNTPATPVQDFSHDYIASVSPTASSTDVSVTAPIEILFKKPMDTESFIENRFMVNTKNGYSIDANANGVTITPVTEWEANSEIIVTIAEGIYDANGQYFYDYRYSFFTESRNPLIESVSPANKQAVDPDQLTITVQFTADMDPSTINESTFYVQGVTGTVSYADRIAVLTMTNAPRQGQYTAVLSSSISTADGTVLGDDYSWGFNRTIWWNTWSYYCTIYPAFRGNQIWVNTDISAVYYFFDEQDFTLQLSASLSGAGKDYTGAIRNIGHSGIGLSFQPDELLEPNTQYTATICGIISNAYTDYEYPVALQWTFTTEPEFEITSVNPQDGEQGVLINSGISIETNSNFEISSFNSQTCYMYATNEPQTVIPCSYSYFRLKPIDRLDYGTSYTVVVTDGISTLSGLTLGEDYTWTFTTQEGAPIHVTSLYPAEEVSDFPVNGKPYVEFDAAIIKSTITEGRFYLTPVATGVRVPATVDNFSSGYILRPDNPLSPNTEYILTIGQDIQAQNLSFLDKTYTIHFRTGAAE